MVEANGERYLTAAEVAPLLKVSVKTIGNYARQGKLPHVRTLGGHRRYPESKIRALVDQLAGPDPERDAAP